MTLEEILSELENEAKRKEIPQAEIARGMHYCPGAVSGWFRKNEISLQALFSLADYLGFDIVLRKKDGEDDGQKRSNV